MAGPEAGHLAVGSARSKQPATQDKQSNSSNRKLSHSTSFSSSSDTIKAVHCSSRELCAGPLEASTRQKEESAWQIVDGRRTKGWSQLARSLGKAIDDLYLTCELDRHLGHVRSVVHTLDDALSDFKQLAHHVHNLSKASALEHDGYGVAAAHGSPTATPSTVHRQAGNSTQRKLYRISNGSTDTPCSASPSTSTAGSQDLQQASQHVERRVKDSKLSAAAKPFRPQQTQQQTQHQLLQPLQQDQPRPPQHIHHPQQQQQQQESQQQPLQPPQQGEAEGTKHLPGKPQQLHSHNEQQDAHVSEPRTWQHQQQLSHPRHARQESTTPCSSSPGYSPATSKGTASSSGCCSSEQQLTDVASSSNSSMPSIGGSSTSAATEEAVQAAEAIAAADDALKGVSSPQVRQGPGLPRTPLSAPATNAQRARSSSGGSSGSNDRAWKGRKNWGTVFERDSASAPPIDIPGRLLHAKLMSPDRMRKTPLETKRAADERQARAEQLRLALVEERMARLAKAQEGRQQAAAVRAKDVESGATAVTSRYDDRHQRSEALRQAHLRAIQRKAGDETRKVEEVTFINLLSAEDRKKSLQQRLEEGGQRRQDALAAIQAKQQGASQAMREAQERRKLMEAGRLAQLAGKFKRKQLAQAKLEEERQSAVLAREQQKAAQTLLAQQAEAARQLEAAARTLRINERLKEAAHRRMCQLELIRERAAAPGGKDPTERRHSFSYASFSLTSPRGLPPPSPARAAAATAAAAAAGAGGHGAGDGRAGSTTPTRRVCVSPSVEWYGRWMPGPWEGSGTQSLAVGAVTPASSLRHRLKGARRRAAKMAKRLEDIGCSWEEPAAAQALTAPAHAEIMHTEWRTEVAAAQAHEACSQERRAAFERLANAAASQLAAHRLAACHVARQCGLLQALCDEVTAAVASSMGRGNSGSKGSSVRAQGHAVLSLLVQLLSERTNCDYMLALGLAPAFARAAISALDHCNSLAVDDAEEAVATRHLDMLLQVLVAVLSHRPTEPRLQRALDALLGYSLAIGIVHRVSEAFSIFDRPTLATGPVPHYVLQCLRLLQAMTAAGGCSSAALDAGVPGGRDCTGGRPGSEQHEGRQELAGAKQQQGKHTCQQQQEQLRQQEQQEQVQLRPDRRWPSTGPNTAALVIALQETSVAGLLSLLTAVLLHAAPSCTPAEASPDQLPSNFCTAAHLVMSTLNNVARLDLLAAQQLLSSTHNRLEFFHLASFLLSYCTNQWPQQGHSTLREAAAAAAAAGNGTDADGSDTHARASSSNSSSSADRKSPAKARRGGCISGSRGSKPSRAAKAATAAASQLPLPRPALGAVLAHAACHPVAELLNEVLLLLGYFCVANPSHQVMLQWGRSPSILQRLSAVPFAYFCDPRLVDVAMPTLLSVCYGVAPACEVMEQSLDAGVLLAYVEDKVLQEQLRQQRQQQGLQRQQQQVLQPGSQVLDGLLGRLLCSSSAAQPAGAARFSLAQRFPVELLPQASAFFRARVGKQGLHQ